MTCRIMRTYQISLQLQNSQSQAGDSSLVNVLSAAVIRSPSRPT